MRAVFSRLSGGARSTPPATVKAASAGPAQNLPDEAPPGAKLAVFAASISLPNRSALAMNCGNASGFTPSMTSDRNAAVPEPESVATRPPTDFPLAVSTVETSPIPLRPVAPSAVARSALLSFI